VLRVFSKQSRPDGSFLSAPVTVCRIKAALSGETTERVARILGTAIDSLVVVDDFANAVFWRHGMAVVWRHKNKLLLLAALAGGKGVLPWLW
jgi:hypothetical protein